MLIEFSNRQIVGSDKPNSLGLYYLFGLVLEWCYDSGFRGNIRENKTYSYDIYSDLKRVKGFSEFYEYKDIDKNNKNYNIGLRIVRTV